MNIISCSRRTDIPSRYPAWLDACLAAGKAVFRAPRGALRSVPLTPQDVHSLVLWSKNYAPLLGLKGVADRLDGMNPFFHFTLTGLGGSPWEPGIPGWRESLGTMAALADRFGPERINWRFDPVVVWHEKDRRISNSGLFGEIGEQVARLGIATCTFSFAHWYRKSSRRASEERIAFQEPEAGEAADMAAGLAGRAAELGIMLAICCDERIETLPGIVKASCVDAALLSSLRKDGLQASVARDTSQRAQCGCSRSVDIGSYAQRCYSNPCLYCYAN